MARKKDPNGVCATIERVTGQAPCPDYLRTTLNKYLKEAKIFPSARTTKGKVDGKLSAHVTDVLVKNILLLDQFFCGDTTFVSRLVTGEATDKEIQIKLNSVEPDMQRRLDIYTFNLSRFSSLRVELLNGSIDFRENTLLLPTNMRSGRTLDESRYSFGLRAVQMLEEVERKGNPIQLSVSGLVDRADVYFSLGDYENADQNATQALSIDRTNSRAWFIRVMIAMRRRHEARKGYKKYRIEAEEIAEPMSSHESNAYFFADMELDKASRHHSELRSIISNAIIFWPRDRGNALEHATEFEFIRREFIKTAFRTIFSQRPLQSYERSIGPTVPGYLGIPIEKIFNESEIHALNTLANERDKRRGSKTYIYILDDLRQDIELLHLRFVLGDSGYSFHWESLFETISIAHARIVKDSVLTDPNVAHVWQHHLSINKGEVVVADFFENFNQKWLRYQEEKIRSIWLQQSAIQFDRMYVNQDFSSCSSLARNVEQRLDGYENSKFSISATFSYPADSLTSIPIAHKKYWIYLKLVAICSSIQSDLKLNDIDYTELLLADDYLAMFSQQHDCFWLESEMFDGGGGTDWYREPFDVDLTDKKIWIKCIRKVLPLLDNKDLQANLEKTLTNLFEHGSKVFSSTGGEDNDC